MLQPTDFLCFCIFLGLSLWVPPLSLMQSVIRARLAASGMGTYQPQLAGRKPQSRYVHRMTQNEAFKDFHALSFPVW